MSSSSTTAADRKVPAWTKTPAATLFRSLLTVGCGLAALLVAAWLGTSWGHEASALMLNTLLAFLVGRTGRLWPGVLLSAMATIGSLGPKILRTGPPGAGDFESAFAGAVLLVLAAEAGRRIQRLSASSHASETTDPLTGVLNQTGFTRHLNAEINRAMRNDSAFAVVFLDGDRFKDVNDRQGHLAGDRFLCESADAIRSAVRNYDTIGRWGGDEFTMLLPDCSPLAAATVVTRVQHELNELAKRRGHPVTWSAGIVVARGRCSAEQVVRAADQMMYEAKRTAPGSLVLKELQLVRPPDASASL